VSVVWYPDNLKHRPDKKRAIDSYGSKRSDIGFPRIQPSTTMKLLQVSNIKLRRSAVLTE